MISCRFGDVVLVPFPFTDQSSSKRRPAVVVSSSAHIRGTGDLVILAISSQRGRPVDLEVRDWQEAGLLKPSVFKPVVTTIESSLILKKLGALTGRDLSTLRQMIDFLLSGS